MSSLVQRVIHGEPEAVSQFYRLYAPKIERYLIKRLPVDDAKEITNDVFIDAIDSLVNLKTEDNVLGWLCRIAHHKAVDFYRKRKIKSILLSTLPFLEPLAAEIDQPEFQLEKKILRARIQKVFYIISEKYRRILRLYYEEEYSIKEIATILNLSSKATESLLFRARQSFKEGYGRT